MGVEVLGRNLSQVQSAFLLPAPQGRPRPPHEQAARFEQLVRRPITRLGLGNEVIGAQARVPQQMQLGIGSDGHGHADGRTQRILQRSTKKRPA
ncbi:MAG: hypothetical protein ABI633_00920 [Burkholderiales bacterium]